MENLPSLTPGSHDCPEHPLHFCQVSERAGRSTAWRGSQGPWSSHTASPCLLAAAKSLQSCPTLCDPIDGSPPGSAIPGILQARTLEWVAISFSNAWKWEVKVKSLSCVWLFTTPWTAAYQAPPSMGFSRQENWSGLPLPSPILGYTYSLGFGKGKRMKCSILGIRWLLICSLWNQDMPKLSFPNCIMDQH